MDHVPDIPPLPQGNWEADVMIAHATIKETLHVADNLLHRQEGEESIPYKVAADNVRNLAHWVDGLERCGLDEEWLGLVAEIIVTTENQLRQVALYLADE